MAAQPTAARAPARLAWSLCALALALVAATLLVLLAGRPPASSAGDAWQRQAADLLSLVGAPLGVSSPPDDPTTATGGYGWRSGWAWRSPPLPAPMRPWR